MIQLRKELSLFFSNFSFLWILTFILLVTGGFLWIFPDSSYLSYGIASGELYFGVMNWLAILWIPVLGISLYQYERSNDMIDSLAMIPKGWARIHWAKFWTGTLLILCFCLFTLVHVLILSEVGSAGIQDGWPFVFSWVAMILLFGCYLSISLFVAVYIHQAIVSVIFAVLICFMFYQGIDLIAQIPSLWGAKSDNIGLFSLSYHANLLSMGVLSLSSFVYITSLVLGFNFLSIYLLQKPTRKS